MLEEQIEQCSHKYNWMCVELQRCNVPIRLFRLHPVMRELKRVKVLLKKIICAHVQVTLIRRRIQALDGRIQRRMEVRARSVSFQILNEFEVYKGVLRMYVVYTASHLHQVRTTLEKCKQRLTKVMRP